QAEDGIRDFHVTGVQTCALPIYVTAWTAGGRTAHPTVWSRWWSAPESPRRAAEPAAAEADAAARPVSWAPRRRCGRAGRHARPKIGRASCRERVEVAAVGGQCIK